MSPIDKWLDSIPLQPSPSPSPSPSSSPSRASRTRGVTNQVAHRSFSRLNHPDDPIPQVFSLGDVVLVGGPKGITRQKWLAEPEGAAARSKGKGKRKAAQAEEEGWTIQDGLQQGQKLALITGLYEDLSTNSSHALLRWFCRPASLWGRKGPPEGEEVRDWELYYTSDSSWTEERRGREGWDPKGRTGGGAGGAGAMRTPLHSDAMPLEAILGHAQILTPKEIEGGGGAQLGGGSGTIKSWLVRKVYDAKPVHGAEWLGEIDYLEVWRRGMELGEWDVEAILEEEPESDDDDDDLARRRKKRKVIKKVKVKTTNNKRRKPTYVEPPKSDGEQSSSSSSDDDSEDGETFRRNRHQSSSPSSSSDDEGSHTSASNSAANSDLDLDMDIDDMNSKRKSSSPSKMKKQQKKAARRIQPRPTSAAQSRASQRRAQQSAYRAKKLSSSSMMKSTTTSSSTTLPLLHSSHLPANFPTLSPAKQAQILLHVSATPEFLPCREGEREEIGGFVAEGILSGVGGCLYIHGVPGTGKTATVHSVVRELQGDEDIPPFKFIEINGLKISEPAAAFSILWEALSPDDKKQKLGPKQALGKLELWFREPEVGRGTTVVLIDELDQMLTKRQEVVYNFFNWPHMPHSKLIVIAVANTMDLPERELGGKVRSRLGSNRIVFTPYKWDELAAIIQARLKGITKGGAGAVFADRAVEHIAKRVAGGAGDARRALDIARRTVEKVEQENTLPLPQGKVPRLCTISDASATYREMTDYGSNAFVKGASLMEKVFLLSLAQVVKRKGVVEVELDEILAYHLRFLAQTSLLPSSHPPAQSSLFALVASLHSQRLIVADSQRGDYYQRVRMLVGTGELFEVLREDEDLKSWVPKV